MPKNNFLIQMKTIGDNPQAEEKDTENKSETAARQTQHLSRTTGLEDLTAPAFFPRTKSIMP